MKQLLTILMIAFALVVGTQACKKKEDAEKKENEVKVNGENFYINHTYSIDGVYNSSTQMGNGIIKLFSISSDNKEIKQLVIGIEYKQKDNIDGEYNYPKKEGNQLLKKESTYYKVMNNSTSNYTSLLKSGKIVIKNNKDLNYTINIDIITEKGDRIKGKFSNNFTVNLK